MGLETYAGLLTKSKTNLRGLFTSMLFPLLLFFKKVRLLRIFYGVSTRRSEIIDTWGKSVSDILLTVENNLSKGASVEGQNLSLGTL